MVVFMHVRTRRVPSRRRLLRPVAACAAVIGLIHSLRLAALSTRSVQHTDLADHDARAGDWSSYWSDMLWASDTLLRRLSEAPTYWGLNVGCIN